LRYPFQYARGAMTNSDTPKTALYCESGRVRAFSKLPFSFRSRKIYERRETAN
jgi:hypothetical protein